MSKTDAGFSMIEMLLVMMLISAFSLIALKKHSKLDLEAYYYLNDYLYVQAEAMLKRQDRVYDKGVTFNGMGHVNLARTISFGKHEVIVHLGNGYATIE